MSSTGNGDFAGEGVVFKVVFFACITFYFYYIVLHLDDEVKYIWSKRWTAGKVAYLLGRYSGAAYLILLWFAVGYPFVDLPHTSIGDCLRTCLNGHLFTGVGTMVILFSQIILQMRVYALFEGARKMLIFLVALSLALFGFNILQASLNLNGQVVTSGSGSSPVENYLQSCLNASFMSGIAWTLTAFVELILFFLVVWRMAELNIPQFRLRFTRGSTPQAEDVMAIMARDSLIYFAITFSICFLGAILVDVAVYNHQLRSSSRDFLQIEANAYQTVAITIMAILTPKLLINIRAEFYGPDGINMTHLSWDAHRTGGSSTIVGSNSGFTTKDQSSVTSTIE